MDQGQLYTLIARKLSGEASEQELEQLHTHLANHPQQQYLENIIEDFWFSGKQLMESTDEDQQEELHFRQILAEANKEEANKEEANKDEANKEEANKDEANKVFDDKANDNHEELPGDASATSIRTVQRKSHRYWYAAAAVLVLSLSITLHYTLPNKQQPKLPALKEVVSRSGSRSAMVLPDGTKVWLNADSKLVYGEDFNGKLRQVTLEGEGFFDVVKDPSRPFIVHTSTIDIRVLGTAFNVKAYAMDSTIETTLLRGLVEVIRKDDPSSPKLILRPNEKLVFNKEIPAPPHAVSTKVPVLERTHEKISIEHIRANTDDSIRVETSWRFNRLVFDGESFEQLAMKIGRWYNVNIVFEDEDVRSYRFRGIFEKETIEQALDALQLTAPFEYKINGRNIRIRKK